MGPSIGCVGLRNCVKVDEGVHWMTKSVKQLGFTTDRSGVLKEPRSESKGEFGNFSMSNKIFSESFI